MSTKTKSSANNSTQVEFKEMTMNMDLFDIIKHGFLPVEDLPNRHLFDSRQMLCLEPWVYDFLDPDITGWGADFEFELFNVDDVFLVSWTLHQPNSEWYADDNPPATTELTFWTQVSAVGCNICESASYPVQSWQEIHNIHAQHWKKFVKKSVSAFESKVSEYFATMQAHPEFSDKLFSKKLYTLENYQQVLQHWRRYRSVFSRHAQAFTPVHIEHSLKDFY